MKLDGSTLNQLARSHRTALGVATVAIGVLAAAGLAPVQAAAASSGTPHTAAVMTAASARPDALVSSRSASKGFVGNNVYNLTGRKQTVTVDARRGRTRAVWVKVANDGNALATLTIRALPAPSRTSVRYFLGRVDVTGQVRSMAGFRIPTAPGASHVLRVQVTPSMRAEAGARKVVSVSGNWHGASTTRRDVVHAVVRVRR